MLTSRFPSSAFVAIASLLLLPVHGALGQLLPGSSTGPSPIGNVHFDEQGVLTLDTGLVIHGTLVAGGGIDYTLPGPVQPGAVLVLGASDAPVGALGISDRLDFSNDASGKGHMLYRSLLDDTDAAADPADVASFPTTDTAITTPETGPEGDNGFIYQTSGAIYFGVSDAVPEPALLGLLLTGAAAVIRGRTVR